MCYTIHVSKTREKDTQKGKVTTMKKIAILILMLMVGSLLMYGCNTALDKVTTDKAIEATDKAGDVRTVECTAIAEDNNTVTLQDEQGWLWQVHTEECSKGDSMIAWIADNGTTNNPTDDKVLYTVKVVTD